MLIPLGKLYTAFRLTPAEVGDLLRKLRTQPTILINRLIINPADRVQLESDLPMELTYEVACEYAKGATAEISRSYDGRVHTINLAIQHLTEMYQMLEVESYQPGLDQLAKNWLDDKYNGLVGLISGRPKLLAQEVESHLADSYVFFAEIELEEAVWILHQAHYPFHQEVKGLTRERYREIVRRHEASASAQEKISAEPAFEKKPREKGPKRLPVSHLLKAIENEAALHGLGKKYYATTDRTIRNWLNGSSTPPACFSPEVMTSHDTIAAFAKSYIEFLVAAGSSELAANAKKEVALNAQLHGVKLETPEDALLLAESCQEYADYLQGGSKAERKRKVTRK